MKPRWLPSQKTQELILIALLGIDIVASHVLGASLSTGLGTETGLLLLWGVAHCDTLDGPLVTLGMRALEIKNVNLVLPWVRVEDEAEIRHAFHHAQAVRELGPQARGLADRHFLETLVRIHRAGEGAPFSGLKPAGLDLGPAVPAADRTLRVGSPDAVIELLVQAVENGVRRTFRAAMEQQSFDPNDVSAGRKFVNAYVAYVHYVERLWEAASASSHGHSHQRATAASHEAPAEHHH
jgi:hypothetical protein